MDTKALSKNMDVFRKVLAAKGRWYFSEGKSKWQPGKFSFNEKSGCMTFAETDPTAGAYDAPPPPPNGKPTSSVDAGTAEDIERGIIIKHLHELGVQVVQPGMPVGPVGSGRAAAFPGSTETLRQFAAIVDADPGLQAWYQQNKAMPAADAATAALAASAAGMAGMPTGPSQGVQQAPTQFSERGGSPRVGVSQDQRDQLLSQSPLGRDILRKEDGGHRRLYLAEQRVRSGQQAAAITFSEQRGGEVIDPAPRQLYRGDGGMSVEERRQFLAATPLGREILQRELAAERAAG